MTRSLSVWFVVLVFVTAGALAGYRADAPDVDGKAGPKSPAQLLIGTWTSTGYDNFKPAWWHSVRYQFKSDGTWRIYSNDDWYLFRTERTRGTYEIVGDTLRLMGPESPESDERLAAGIGPYAPLRIHTWEKRISTLDGEHLVLSYAENKANPPQQYNYRRVR